MSEATGREISTLENMYQWKVLLESMSTPPRLESLLRQHAHAIYDFGSIKRPSAGRSKMVQSSTLRAPPRVLIPSSSNSLY